MQTTAPVEAMSRLAYFPVSIFSIVMGTSGLAIAWQRAQLAATSIVPIWFLIAVLATFLFVAFLLAYALKLARYPEHVASEWKNPVRVNFFPAMSISLLLLAVVWRQTIPLVAFYLWALGALVHITFTIAILSSWIYHTHYDIQHANPAWFIPVVGNLFVPISATSFGFTEVGWFYFSIGIIFWLVLMTIVFYRVFFHDPIPSRLLPTLFILIAPPAVGFLAYHSLGGGLDGFSRVLYYTGLFITMLLAANARRFAQVGFFLSSWAYSFPLAAITIATFLMAQSTGYALFTGLAFVLLAMLSTIVAYLGLKTIGAAARNAICVPE